MSEQQHSEHLWEGEPREANCGQCKAPIAWIDPPSGTVRLSVSPTAKWSLNGDLLIVRCPHCGRTNRAGVRLVIPSDEQFAVPDDEGANTATPPPGERDGEGV